MEISFIKKYLLKVAESVLWAFLGAMVTINIYPVTNIFKTVILSVCVLIAIFAVQYCICFFDNRKRLLNNTNVNAISLNEAGISKVKENMINNNSLQTIEENKVNFVSQNDGYINKKINKISLIGEEGNELLEWSLEGKTSVIIGKGTDKEPVDIDLGRTAMAQLVSKQHAVLNYTDNGWYVDDIDSKNGTRVKKRNQNGLLDAKLVGAVEVEAGDIIYISSTMLRLK